MSDITNFDITYDDGYFYVVGFGTKILRIKISLVQSGGDRENIVFEEYGPVMLYSASSIKFFSSKHNVSTVEKGEFTFTDQ